MYSYVSSLLLSPSKMGYFSLFAALLCASYKLLGWRVLFGFVLGILFSLSLVLLLFY